MRVYVNEWNEEKEEERGERYKKLRETSVWDSFTEASDPNITRTPPGMGAMASVDTIVAAVQDALPSQRAQAWQWFSPLWFILAYGT